MSAIDSLLRTQRWAIRERRQALTDMAGLAERLRRDLKSLESQLAASAESLGQDDGDSPTPDRAALEARCSRLQVTLKDIEREAAALEKELQDALNEVEDVEQANRNRQTTSSRRVSSREGSMRERLATSFYQTRARRQT